MAITHDSHERKFLSPYTHRLPPPQSIDTAFTKGWNSSRKKFVVLDLVKFLPGKHYTALLYGNILPGKHYTALPQIYACIDYHKNAHRRIHVYKTHTNQLRDNSDTNTHTDRQALIYTAHICTYMHNTHCCTHTKTCALSFVTSPVSKTVTLHSLL